MKTGTKYFADSYAIIEILKGNKRYTQYLDYQLVTMKFALAEIYYFLLRTDVSYAKQIFSQYSHILIETSLRAVRVGTAFKFKYRKEKLSYVDCVGYAMARELNIPFLTGDEKFKDKPNVEFVQ